MAVRRIATPRTEAQHQAAVMMWAEQPAVRSKWPCLATLYHIPNGGSRDPVEGMHLKRQGVRRGVPDLHLPVARGSYHSLYIEMKADTGKASPDQVWWLDKLNEQGSFATISYGWESAVKVLEWYLSLGGTP